MARLVGERSPKEADPEVAAQFSVRTRACALFSGGFSLRHLQPAALSDSALRAFAERIGVVVEPSLSGKFAPAEVEVMPASGAAVQCRVDVMPGTPEAPMDDATHTIKLMECFGAGAKPLEPDAYLILAEQVAHSESLPSVRALFEGTVVADLR